MYNENVQFCTPTHEFGNTQTDFECLYPQVTPNHNIDENTIIKKHKTVIGTIRVLKNQYTKRINIANALIKTSITMIYDKANYCDNKPRCTDVYHVHKALVFVLFVLALNILFV